MKYLSSITFSDLFGVSFICGAITSLVIGIVTVIWLMMPNPSGFQFSQIMLFLFFLALFSIVFQAVYLPFLIVLKTIINFFSKINSKSLVVIFFSAYGVVQGLVLAGLINHNSTRLGLVIALFGGVAGLMCSLLWIYVDAYRLRVSYDAEANDRVLFVPSWFPRKRNN